MATSAGVFARVWEMHLGARGCMVWEWKGEWWRTRVGEQTFKSAARVVAVQYVLVCRISIMKGRFKRWLIMHQILKLTRPPSLRYRALFPVWIDFIDWTFILSTEQILSFCLSSFLFRPFDIYRNAEKWSIEINYS